MTSSEGQNGEPNYKNTVTKEVVMTKTANGGDVELNIVTHSQQSCQEFVIKSPKFSFRRWFMWTLVLYGFGFYLQLHVQELRLMAYVIVILLLILFIKLHFKVRKESLLVMASIGVQLTTTFASGRKTSVFYDMAHIRDVVINEAVTMHRVIYYLVILLNQCPTTKNTITSLVPLYTHSWPALKCLLLIRTKIVEVFKAGRKCNDFTIAG